MGSFESLVTTKDYTIFHKLHDCNLKLEEISMNVGFDCVGE
jgi:hypothetical protein